MTLFHTSIEKVIQGIQTSNYPATLFEYVDEFVEDLHFRLPPPGLVEIALHEHQGRQDSESELGDSEKDHAID